MEAIYNEMRKLGVTSGTTAEFTLRDLSAGSRQASVTDDNHPKTSTDDDPGLDRVVLPPTDMGICIINLFTYLQSSQGSDVFFQYMDTIGMHVPTQMHTHRIPNSILV